MLASMTQSGSGNGGEWSTQGNPVPGFIDPNYLQAPPPQEAPHTETKKNRGLGALAIAALMIGSAAVGGLAGGFVAGSGDQPAPTNVSQGNSLDQPGQERSEPAPEGSVEEVAQAVLPSVVSIEVSTPAGTESGSGSILSSDGKVLTNEHVVANANAEGSQMTVLLHDGSVHEATYIAGHAQTDIAVIQIEGVNNLQPITLGNSDSVQVGQDVIAIGSPLGLSSTVTSGIVSAKNRPVSAMGQDGEESVIDAIQTDAAINPGNSGGALVDMEGNLVGVPSVIASNTESSGQAGSIGLGFAIPVNQARRIAEELIETQSVQMPAINAQIDTRVTNGALIGEVLPGGAAAGAGLQPGDLITEVDGRRIDSGLSLIATIRSQQVGDTLTLTVENTENGEQREVPVTLEAARE